ncbi:MAG TPA: S8 family peptidase [Myxococcales bacterium]|nr:S8 family peptidase [Myxococcales bacterium]
MLRFANSLAPICALSVILLGAGASSAQEDALPTKVKQRRSSTYIVRMSEDPVVAYQGGVPGLRATKPGKGQKIDPNDPAVVNYARYLDSKHDGALAAVGGGRKLYDYRYSLNGFAAQLTAEQAAKLAATPGVAAVEPDVAVPVDTITTPRFLGLTASGGLWSQLGGFESAGEDVVIGDIDTGVWPEHPSFSDRTGTNPNGVPGKLDYHQIPGWHGKCVPGQAFNASNCNQKLIGCQFYVQGFGVENLDATEFLSCRDSDSHGTHTATTAGGNHGVPVVVDGVSLGQMSGIAPRARIAAYKTCWRAPGATASCFGSDRAAAIDQAVADGVDVLNHSIGATQTNFLDQVQVAFLFAAQAGVFVAASGGNSGPTSATVASPGPWLTTVAASTHDRFFGGTVDLGNGASFSGASLTAGTAMLPLIYAGSAPAAVDPTPNDTTPFATRVALCFVGHLDRAKAAGKIVLCDRGINARVDKSLAVQQAGGAGMILRNLGTTTGVNADLHHVPSVHVEGPDGVAIKAYVDATGAAATAKLAGNIPGNVPAPVIAGFSSRGPIRATRGDILKPDLTAPGVDVLAGVSPAGDGGRLFDFLSGTSMSSPHVAGLGALLKQRHPDWSPMMIKSALMTTATHILGAGSSASPFAEGAGHVKPNAAADPGLVYDHGFSEWVAFICGTGQLTGCANVIDPSDLNQASIAIGDLAGSQTVTRTVTNVGPRGTYTVSVSAPPGIGVSVSPTTLTLAPGQSAGYSVTFTRTSAAFANFPSGFQFGALIWSDGAGHNVRSPLVVRPVPIAVPAQVSGTGASGSVTFQARFGFSGAFAASPHGLVPAAKQAGHVLDDPDNNFNTAKPTENKGFTAHTLVIPTGTSLSRIALFDGETDGNDDLDLYVYGPATGTGVGPLVGASGGPTAAEEVSLNNPAAGAYTVFVHAFDSDGPDANYTLFTWSAGPDAGNLTVSVPATVTTGGTGNVTVNWTGLAPATKYLGVVTYQTPEVGRTAVRIDTP